ncbi:MAG: hypothetical protein ACC645_08200 [Pirellulales bacterium]
MCGAASTLSAAVFFVMGGLAAMAAPADTLDRQYDRLIASYARQLDGLARADPTQQRPALAGRIGNWLPRRPPDSLLLFVHDVAGEFDKAEPPPSTPDSWYEKFTALRHAQADRLWELANRAVSDGQSALACRLATEAVRENRDHAAARRTLGFRKVGHKWLSPFAAKQFQRGLVWHGQFGWIRAGDVRRYESGERREGSRWIDARHDAAGHRNMQDGWRIETDHFLVTTNHSLEAGIRLAERLERLYQAWHQVFAPYEASSSRWQARFAGRPRHRRTARKHRVDYYRSREEYNAALRTRQPRIAMTLGIYFDQERRSCFFAGDDTFTTTLFHEATHQLFQETRRVTRHVGSRNNFWVVEGVATYMESLTEHDDYVTLGGDHAGRLPAARARLLDDGYYVPLAKLTQLGTQDLQQRDDLRRLYSQTAGFATFLMHGRQGQYRDALLRYLAAVYTDRADAGTLAKLTTSSYDQLDREYRQFLEETRADQPAVSAAPEGDGSESAADP